MVCGLNSPSLALGGREAVGMHVPGLGSAQLYVSPKVTECYHRGPEPPPARTSHFTQELPISGSWAHLQGAGSPSPREGGFVAYLAHRCGLFKGAESSQAHTLTPVFI